MAEFRQTSFAGGEFAPALWSRTELERYGTALRTCRNFRVTEHGNLENRPGTGVCGEVDGSARARFIRFVYSDAQAYQLVWTDRLVQFVFDGAFLEASPGVRLEVVTPYLEADLPRLKFSQSGDTLSLTCGGYAPRELVRSGPTTWVLSEVDFDAPAGWTECSVVGVSSSTLMAEDTTHPQKKWDWKVTTIYRDALGRLKESAPVDVSATRSIAYDPWTAGRTYGVGDVAYYVDRPYTCAVAHNLAFPPASYPALWTAGGVGPNTGSFQDAPEEVVLYPDKVIRLLWGQLPDSGIAAWSVATTYAKWALVVDLFQVYVALTAVASGGTAPSANPAKWAPINSATATQEVVGHRVYRGRDGVFGYVGEVGAGVTQFDDDGQIPDFAVSPPQSTHPFAVRNASGTITSYDWPAAVTYFGGRRYFTQLGRIQGSCVNDYARFDVSPVVRADEAVDWTLASRQFEEIRNLVGLDFLVALTASSEWGIRGASGGESEAISPTSILAKVASERGSSWLDALVVEDVILHVQAKGQRVRELAFDGQRGQFAGGDLSIYARHLFAGRTVVDWAYQEDPDSTVWLVLDDGSFLSLTYNRAQQMWAWARHDTDGLVEAVSCIPEGNEDAVYLVVARTVGGATKRFVERMASRRVLDVREGLFLDCSLSYDGRNTTAKTLTLTGGSAWAPDELLTVTASSATFAGSNVGDAVVVNPDGDGSVLLGSPVPLVITAYTSPTVVTARLDATLPAAYRGVATTAWALAVNAYAGLGHLEGREVYALADGLPVGPFTVTAGAITLDAPAAVVHVGLPYDQEVETLDFVGAPQSRWKAVEKVILEVESTRGELQVGESLDTLYAWRQRRVDHGYGVVPLETFEAEVRVSSKWARAGRVALRNTDPTPVTILAVTREVTLGG